MRTGKAEAVAGLARVYIQRGKKLAGMEKVIHFKGAIVLLEMAREKGSVCARNVLEGCYKVGVGVSLDTKKAMLLWKESTEKGDVHAPKRLDDWFLSYDGGQDWEKGARYLAPGRWVTERLLNFGDDKMRT